MPEWVKQTPPEHSYFLAMFESDSVTIQEIALTLAEYIALKSRLAEMRGYVTAPAAVS